MGPTEDGRTLLTIDSQLRGDAVTRLDVYADGEACGPFLFTDHPTPDGGAEFELARDDQPAACGRDGAIITLVMPQNGVRLSAIYRLKLGFRIPIQNFTIPPPHTGGAAPTPEAPAVGSGLSAAPGGSPGSGIAGVVTVAVLVTIAAHIIATGRREA